MPTLTVWQLRCGLGAVLLAAATACATNPVTGTRQFMLMSEGQEIEIGRQYDAEIRREMGVYEDAALQRYVEDIGLRMAAASHRPELPWSFAVVDVPVINAFALPGGFIYLTRGILAYLNDEAELAGVLGHEITHVTARHSAQQYTRATGGQIGLVALGIFVPGTRPFGQLAEAGLGILLLSYGRDAEVQADRVGAEYAAQTGWDPGGITGMLTTLARIDEVSDRRGIPSWLSTHPEPLSRVDEAQDAIDQLRREHADLAVNRERYRERIDGMVYGDSPHEGIVRGSLMLHPDLRFSVQFPDGWEVNNGRTQVVARQPGEDIYLLLELVENPRGRLEDVAVNEMRSAGFRRIEGSLTSINGLEAHVGTYEGSMQNLGRVTVRAAHIVHERNIFLLAGFARPEPFATASARIDTSLRSFRALSRAEAAEIRPNRLTFYTVRQGDTWQSIAQRADIVRPTTLAIMNGFPVNEQPLPGDRIKIVVPG